MQPHAHALVHCAHRAHRAGGTLIVPQGDVVADIARSEDKLILIPGNVVGTRLCGNMPLVCITAVGHKGKIDKPVCIHSTREREDR